MFSVVENEIRTIWCALDGSSTYYDGQLVSILAASKAHVTGTVVPLAVPAGAADTTNFQLIFGVVVGTNDITATYNSTGRYITGAITQAAQVARITSGFFGAEGMYSKSDPQPLVEVAVIGPNTVLRGDIRNAAVGTAPTVIADADGTDTTGYTTAGLTSACDFTPVANNCTIYCRTGANAGLYRVTNDTSTTAPDVTVAFPYDVALGDTFVRVPMKQGSSNVYIGGPGLYFDVAQTAATNTFNVHVLDMNLTEAGKEHATFCFSPVHFDSARA